MALFSRLESSKKQRHAERCQLTRLRLAGGVESSLASSDCSAFLSSHPAQSVMLLSMPRSDASERHGPVLCIKQGEAEAADKVSHVNGGTMQMESDPSLAA